MSFNGGCCAAQIILEPHVHLNRARTRAAAWPLLGRAEIQTVLRIATCTKSSDEVPVDWGAVFSSRTDMALLLSAPAAPGFGATAGRRQYLRPDFFLHIPEPSADLFLMGTEAVVDLNTQ